MARPKKDTATPFDWRSLRARLEQPVVADVPASIDAEREILRQRARELARRPAASPADATRAEWVVFGLGEERYAVESARVREAASAREITPIPGVPATIRGIAFIRGRVVAVADLRRLFGWADAAETTEGKLVVIESRGIEFGLAVDHLTIVPATGGAAAPRPPGAGGPDPRFVRGVTPEGLILLDLAAITSALTVNEEL